MMTLVSTLALVVPAGEDEVAWNVVYAGRFVELCRRGGHDVSTHPGSALRLDLLHRLHLGCVKATGLVNVP